MSDEDRGNRVGRRVLLSATGSFIGIGALTTSASARGKGRGKSKGRDENKGKGKSRDENKGKDRGREKGDEREDEDEDEKDDEEEEEGEERDDRGRKGAKNTCPEGTVLLAKYEVENGEFVFEKDGDYLEVGDAFEFTVTETKDDGEIIAFEVEDPQGVYDINTLSVKTGDGVFRKTIEGTNGAFDASEFDDSHPVQAVSNVLICAEVQWQVDFGRGDVPEPPRYDFNDLPYAATGNSTDESVDNPSVNRDDFKKFDYVDVIEPPGLEIDFDAGTATIQFEDNTAGKMHLASFEVPGDFELGEVSSQDLFDVEYTTAESGSLTVDIPIPDAYE